MAVWLVRTDATWHGTMAVEFSEGETRVPLRLKIDRHLRKMPRIREGDHTVFARRFEGDLSFYGSARVASVEGTGERDEDPSVEPRGRTPPGVVEFDSFAMFSQERLLTVFALTLSVVRNVKDPGRHFRLPIRRLDARDMAVLIAGEIYVARTAFYQLYYALPARVRDDFERFALTKHFALQNPHASDRRRFALLADYLSFALGPKLHLLVDAERAYARIECDSKPAFETLTSEAASEELDSFFRRPIGRSTAGAARAIHLDGTIDILKSEARAVDDKFEEERWTPLL